MNCRGRWQALTPAVLVWVCGFIVLLGTRAPCVAQEEAAVAADEQAPSPPQGEYGAVIQQAIGAQAAGDFATAHGLFARAHAVMPNARTLRGLGVTSFQGGHFTEAVSELEQAIAHPIKPLEGELRRSTEMLLRRARAEVGLVHLAIEPSGATISVDGAPGTPAEGRLVLAPGIRRLLISAGNHASETMDLEVAPNTEQTLRLRLVALNAVVAPPPIAPPALESDPPGEPRRLVPSVDATRARRLRITAWTSSAVAAAAAFSIAGLWFGSQHRISEISRACSASELGGCTTEERARQSERARLAAFERGLTASWVIAGSAALAAGTTFTWLYLGAESQVTLSLGPAELSATVPF